MTTQAPISGGADGNSSALPPYLSVRNLIDLLRISRTTAYALVSSGQIRSVHIGRAIRIPRAALQAYLDAQAR